MGRVRSLVLAILLVPAIAAAADTVVVQMTSVNGEPRFVPADITIRPGDTVQWVNTDLNLEHSVCSGTGSADPQSGVLWSSPLLRFGQSFEHTFPQAGDFEYYSVPHEYEGMFGVVRVRSGTSGAGGEIEQSSWSLIKQRFNQILPRR
ncbi:MAG: plastocyanin/azurin family copper-binding protein [bacterium]